MLLLFVHNSRSEVDFRFAAAAVVSLTAGSAEGEQKATEQQRNTNSGDDDHYQVRFATVCQQIKIKEQKLTLLTAAAVGCLGFDILSAERC